MTAALALLGYAAGAAWCVPALLAPLTIHALVILLVTSHSGGQAATGDAGSVAGS